MSNIGSLLREQLKLYEADVWKADHTAAADCFDLENAISFGVYLFQRISRADEIWHCQVFNGQQHDDGVGRELTELYQAWASTCDRYLKELTRLEKQGFAVEGAAEFRRCCQEAQGVLIPDAKFFSGDKLVELRDLAIEAHHRNETSPF